MSHCSKCGLVITSEYQYAHEKLCGGPLVKDDMALRIAAWNAEKLQDSEGTAMNTGTNYIHLIARLRAPMWSFEPSDIQSLAAEAADAIERALPAINAWTNPDALRTRIVALTTNPYSPTDSIDSPQPEAT